MTSLLIKCSRNLPLLSILMSLSLFNGGVAAFAGGSTVGNGTALCRDHKSDPLIPCDLFFEQRNFQLPYNSSQEVDLRNSYPDVWKELLVIRDFISNRSYGTLNFFELLPKNLRIFNTEKFLGTDAQYAGPGFEAIQAGYAYWFNHIHLDDLSKKDTNFIVELDLKLMTSELSARFTALVVFHEFLHLVPGLDHSVISPLIKNLNMLLSLRDEQIKGSRRALTPTELKASDDFQMLLSHLGFRSYSDWRIHSNGGGVIYGENDFKNTNFLGVSASLRVPEKGLTYYMDDASLVDGAHSATMLTAGRFFEKYQAGLSVEVLSDGRKNAVVNGKIDPIRGCFNMNAQGKCVGEVSMLPIEIEVRTGADSGVQKLSTSVVRVQGIMSATFDDQGAVSSCEGGFLRTKYEQSRYQAGSFLQFSLIDGVCQRVFKTNDSGSVKIIVQAETDLFGPALWWPEKIPRQVPGLQPTFRSTVMGAQVSGGVGLGVQFFNRFTIMGVLIGKAGEFNTSEPMHMAVRQDIERYYYEYGLRMHYDLGNQFSIQGGIMNTNDHYVQKVYKDFSNPASRNETEFNQWNVNIGIEYQFKDHGPYSKKKKRYEVNPVSERE